MRLIHLAKTEVGFFCGVKEMQCDDGVCEQAQGCTPVVANPEFVVGHAENTKCSGKIATKNESAEQKLQGIYGEIEHGIKYVFC